MKVVVTNSSAFKIKKRAIQKQVKTILELEKIDCDEIYVNYVNTKKISKLHKKYFNDPTPTDCISFPLDAPGDKTSGISILGEIFICPDSAFSYAKKKQADPQKELALYLIHGILHLIGYEDQTEKERRRMRKKEKQCMEYIRKIMPCICI